MSEWLDSVYGDYRAWKGWNGKRNADGEVARAIKELRMAGIAPPATLLEVGFGDGAFLKRAKSLGYDCAGLERDPSSIADLKAHGIDARVGAPSQLPDRHFDVIAAFDVFEHIPVPQLIEHLRQLNGLLRDNGRLLARFPNMASPFGAVNQYGDITHITALSPASFVQLARLGGFELVRAANGATVMSGAKGVRAVLKPLAYAARKLIETVLSFAYYGQLTPLSASVVVILRKRSAAE